MKVSFIFCIALLMQLFGVSHHAIANVRGNTLSHTTIELITTRISGVNNLCQTVGRSEQKIPFLNYVCSVIEEDENEDSHYEGPSACYNLVMHKNLLCAVGYQPLLPFQKYPSTTARYLLLRSIRI